MEHKKTFIETALGQGRIQVMVKTNVEGVKLPEFLMAEPNAILNLSWRFGTLLELTATGIRAVLSFNRKEEEVEFPWESIWFVRLASGTPVMFREDAPIDNLPASILGDRAPDVFKPMREMLEKQDEYDKRRRFKATENEAPELTPPRKGHLKLLN